MFTGIIEELGHVREVEKRGADARIVIEARTVTEDSRNGDSIAVSGVCLTALEVQPDSFAADVSKETEATRKLYGIGEPATSDFGAKCLMARRMVERGVRFIQLYSGSVGDDWDAHA